MTLEGDPRISDFGFRIEIQRGDAAAPNQKSIHEFCRQSDRATRGRLHPAASLSPSSAQKIITTEVRARDLRTRLILSSSKSASATSRSIAKAARSAVAKRSASASRRRSDQGFAGCLYVLDEPSIGLHQRDNDRLIGTLRRLRDLGNSVIVVEHDEDTIRSSRSRPRPRPRRGQARRPPRGAGTPAEIHGANPATHRDNTSPARAKIPVPKTARAPSTANEDLSKSSPAHRNPRMAHRRRRALPKQPAQEHHRAISRSAA